MARGSEFHTSSQGHSDGQPSPVTTEIKEDGFCHRRGRSLPGTGAAPALHRRPRTLSEKAPPTPAQIIPSSFFQTPGLCLAALSDRPFIFKLVFNSLCVAIFRSVALDGPL